MKNLSPIDENKDIVTKEYVDPIKSQAAINRTTLGTQCKNLLKNTAKTSTISGITFTVNDDCSVTANGTNSTSNYVNIKVFQGELEAGTYILSGTPANNSICRMRLGLGTADGYGSYVGVESGNGYTFTVTEKAVYTVLCQITNGKTASNVIFKPMMRYADITDDTYEPYKESVDERLIENKSDIAVNKTTLGYQCKNLLNETEYLSSIKTATNGTLSKSGNSITLTATSNDCYTAPFFVGDNGYRIPVSPNTTYILSWESDNSNYGIIHVFMNGIVSKQQAANNSVAKYLKFTTDIDATFITIRFSVRNSGDSITYSNIMLRDADITDETYEPYQPSLVERCLLKDTAGINLGHVQSSSITIDNLSAYTALWVNVSGGVSGINFQTNLIVPIAYLAKSSSNRVSLAGGIPSSAYITSEGVLAAKNMDGTITAKISGNTLDLTIGTGTIGSIEVVSLM